jgi:hypothetical protein
MFAVGSKISNLLAASRLQFRALMCTVWNAFLLLYAIQTIMTRTM